MLKDAITDDLHLIGALTRHGAVSFSEKSVRDRYMCFKTRYASVSRINCCSDSVIERISSNDVPRQHRNTFCLELNYAAHKQVPSFPRLAGVDLATSDFL